MQDKNVNNWDHDKVIFAAIISSSDDAIMSKTLQGIITSWNPAAERIFGYSEQEALGQPMSMLIPEDRQHEEAEILAKISSGERIKHFETIRINKDGSELNISASISPIFDAENRVVGASKIARDITEQKILEEEQAKFAAIVTSSDDAIMSKTLQGIITSWNPGAERIFGYSEQEAIGQPMAMLIPEGRKHEETEILAKISVGERIKHFETVRVKKDGTELNISASISPIFNTKNEIIGASKIARDISIRKKEERELELHRNHLEELVALATSEVKAILQTAINGVISIDEHGIIHLFNPAAESLFGWRSNEVVGKNVSILMANNVGVKHDGFIQHFINTGEKRIIGIGREITCLRKDGSTFPGHLAVGHTKLKTEHHLFVAFIADITQQKIAEEELILSKNNAETAAKAKANFLANMSHEIRTPMNSIIGFSEIIMQDNNLSADTRNHTNIILNSGRHLLNVINDILDFSKIEAGKINIEYINFNLKNLLKDIISTIAFPASEKGLKLNLEFGQLVPERVVGDPSRLRQVILNLVGNAIKFTAKGKVVIAVKVGDSPDILCFSIADTGIGMNASHLATIFDAFSQADASTSRQYGGTGLGTSISKQLVELMGGEINVESEINKGSTFHFSAHLPVTENKQGCLYDNEIIPLNTFTSPRGFKVLIAEDIEANATLLMLRLKKQNHTVMWAKNGKEALEAYKKEHFDIILMDVQMPVMDGFQATQAIRQLEQVSTKHIPIIALTASVLKEEQDLCIDAGMNIVVGKPISFNELFETMEQLVSPELDNKKAEDTEIKTPEIKEIVNVKIDFSVLEDGVNYTKGLNIWSENLVYANALKGFANEKINDAMLMMNSLVESSDDLTTIYNISHALKGLSGNLALETIFAISEEINDNVKLHNIQKITSSLFALDKELKRVCRLITLLKIPVTSTVKNKVTAKDLPEIFRRLIAKIDEFNPENVTPVLNELEGYLPNEQFVNIQNKINDYDFDSAKIEVIKLMDLIELKGDEV